MVVLLVSVSSGSPNSHPVSKGLVVELELAVLSVITFTYIFSSSKSGC